MQDFCDGLEGVREGHAKFLMVGRRWDAEIGESWDFESKDWEARLRNQVLQKGKRRTPEWIGYFIFTRGLYGAYMPRFVVGRVFCDNWLVWNVLCWIWLA